MSRRFLIRSAKPKDGTKTPKSSELEDDSLNVIPHPPSPPPTSSSTTTGPNQTSPFINVPADILLHIFHMAMALGEGKHRRRYNQHPKNLPLPVCFSQISSYVRSVVLCAPLLWTTIDDAVLNSVAMTDAYLIRSQKSLIDVEYQGSSRRPVELINKLAAHIHRWRRLRFRAGYHFAIKDFGVVVEGLRMLSAPNLTHLDVGLIQGSKQYFFKPTIILTGGTPVLKSLHLRSNSFCLPQSTGAITRFSLLAFPGDMRLPYRMLCDTLTHMYSLTHLQVDGSVTHWPTVEAVKPISLPTLQCLHMLPSSYYDATVTIEDCSVSSLFATFMAPSLQRLSLDRLSPAMLASFLKCLRKGIFSFPQVTSLTWQTEIDSEDATTIVESFPSLENFTLMDHDFDHFSKVLLVHVNEPSGQNPLWPCLRSLSLESYDLSDLRNYVSFRIRLKKPIQMVRLPSSPYYTKENIVHLAFLRAVVDLQIVSSDIWEVESMGWDDD